MALNMKSLTQALAKTAAVIEKHVQSTVQEVTGPKPLQDYELIDQIGSAGPGLAWRLYSARPRNKAEHAHNPEVCVWLLDKKALSETRQRLGVTKAAEDAFLDVLRADAVQLLKLRHPGVVRVVQALDESKTAMAMVTEPIFASLANVLGDRRNLVKLPKVLNGLELSFLEIKHGLLQLAESLSFLHHNAQLVHRAISPETIFITSGGSWKFGGFGFAVSVEQAASGARMGPAFHYSEYDTEESFLPLQPDLDYTAPELTRSGGNPGPCSDIFSLACVTYHLLSREPLMQCKSNLRAYKNKVQYLPSSSYSKIPSELIHGLRSMLSPHELSRPTAKDFTGSPYFREDTRLRALRFLDHMLESDNIQKTDFLKALSSMWKDFDTRVLRYKVLPPLCAELRNAVMLPMVLPMVLTIAESQERADFEISTFPALQPVLSSATGESLLLLVKHAALLINKVGPEHLGTSVVPMLVRAYDDPDARMQEEVLKRTLAIAKQIDYQVLKQSILPRIHALTLRTTVAAVRVNGLLCLGELVHRLDKHAIKEVLQTIKMCTDVDRSAATLMCTLGVANAIHKQFGVEFTAEHVLPLVTPLLTAQQLSSQQFAKHMQFVKSVLSEIEEKRGPGDAQIPHTTAEITIPNGSILDQATTKTNKSTWDIDDWRSMDWTKPAAAVAAKPAAELSVPSAKASTVGAALEWPSTEQQQSSLTELSSTASYGDDFDPFADWPPRPSSAFTSSTTKPTTITSATRPTTQLQPQQDLNSFLSSNKPAVSSSYSASARRLAPPPPQTPATNNAVLDLL